jgi:cytochrome c-type biogenesis protein CcsB
MNKLLKTIFSMEIMTIFLIFMALSCSIATFIENDFGPLGSKAFVYGQIWFEFVMAILILGIIFHIIWFKMYTKKKFFIFMIHIALVSIFIGAAMTRYMGYEAVMTIHEGSMENRIYSSDEYIQVKIDNQAIYDKKVMMTQLSQSSFNYETVIDNKPLQIKFNRFIQNAVEKIVPDENKKPMMNILVSESIGTNSIDLENQKSIESKFITFSLNKKIESNKPMVNFETLNKDFFISSNIELALYSNDLNKEQIINANTKIKIDTNKIYKIGQTQFKISDAQLSAEVKIVSEDNHKIPKEQQLNAIILDLIYDNKTTEIPLYGKGGSSHGISKKLTIQDKQIELTWGSKEFILPFAILLDDFKLERYPGSNAPSSYSSKVKVYDKDLNNSFEYTIFMNNVLDYKGFRFFQSSYKQDESATILSVNKDPGKIPTYIGYFLLFTGLILTFFVKNSRFKKLSSKRFDIEDVKKDYYLKKGLISLFLISLFFYPTNSFSNENLIPNIDKNHSSILGELIIQDYQGRLKPLNSLAIEILNKVSNTSKVNNLDANQFFISMLLYPEIWKIIPIYKVKDEKIKELLGVDKNQSYFRFNDIYTKDSQYKLESALELANSKSSSSRDNFDKELIKIDERLNISYSLFIGDFLRVFPLKNDPNNKWLNINEALSDELEQSNEINILTRNYYFSLLEGAKTDDWSKANIALQNIKDYQANMSSIIPSKFKIKSELFFNKFNIFERLTPFYLILGFSLLILVFINIFKPNLRMEKIIKITLVLIILGFVLHTLGLALRWYISGHAPWSNGYESMIYIAWAITLSGIIFSKQSHLALATTSILTGITLFVAHLSWLEPQITTLAPVLKSYWLTIHVSIITASYGFLALSCLLGFITLCLFIFANPKKENDNFFKILLSIKESNRINEMAILMGLVFLIIGNFLGGIWANESWGRYWGWDPKETWTLISIIIYSIIIHLKYIKNLMGEYLLSLLSVISYFSIIMTYFGVNYFLSGKHSYAAGEAVPIPSFIYIALLVIVIVILLSYRNRRVL